MFELEEVITQDGIVLQGLISIPKGNKDAVLIWVHGLTSNFYGNSNLIKSVAKTLNQDGIAFATFNNRGHDMISSFKRVSKIVDSFKYSYVNIGAGYEVFEECIYDIEAAVNYLVSLGYKKIFLAGHSSGANKVAFYQGKKNSHTVSGVILLSPLSDRLIGQDSEKDKKKSADGRKPNCSRTRTKTSRQFGFFPYDT